ncbi:alpha/beta-hydrolase [Hyaloscypha variabilis]
MKPLRPALSLGFLFLSLLFSAHASPSATTPQVDLGYEIHEGWLNDTGAFYNFSNIPYGQPPLGNLRFSAPLKPIINDTKSVNNGSRFALCLLLDVLVPRAIFDNRGRQPGAPVLVWIHGGGYTLGWKTQYGSGAGLVRASQNYTKPGIVYVAINYRLGLFGFLSGPSFQQNGTANNGLLDQRLALEWVQDNIAKFGGDPSQVTVMGESAGGGSTIHQITAYGGSKGKVPFQQAIVQNGAFLPVTSRQKQEDIFQRVLTTAGVSTLQDARNLSTEVLQLTNAKIVGQAAWGDFIFNPVVDGSFTPALPGELLLHGRYDTNLTVMMGHNTDEASEFTSPYVNTTETFNQNVLQVSFPNINGYNTASYVMDTLYPPIYDGSHGYESNFTRATSLVSDALFQCNANYLARAFGAAGYAYQFSVNAARHGDDITYTFYEGPADSIANDTLALAMQDIFTNFVISGNPNRVGSELPYFPDYSQGNLLYNFNKTLIDTKPDNLNNDRCRWWQKAFYA